MSKGKLRWIGMGAKAQRLISREQVIALKIRRAILARTTGPTGPRAA